MLSSSVPWLEWKATATGEVARDGGDRRREGAVRRGPAGGGGAAQQGEGGASGGKGLWRLAGAQLGTMKTIGSCE